jgi:M6 family metalloprotease-like protein
MRPLSHLIRCSIAAVACLVVIPAVSHAQLADMGHRAIATDGNRPLLTIMAQFSDERFDAGHDAPFYADLLFSGGADLADYFKDNSNGAFTFTAAGILGPYTQPNDPSTPLDESTYSNRGASPRGACRRHRDDGSVDRAYATRCHVLMQAAQAGFPFASFDRDHDACLENDELTVMIVFAEPSRDDGGAPTGGQTSPMGPFVLPGAPSVALCADVANVGEAVPASTAAHELTHTLGAEHSYGSSCRNYRFTVMSCPLGGEDDRRTVHLDPFVKMKLGWLRPTPVTTTTAACVKLRAVDLPSLAGTSRAYVIHDPARGPYEYFLLEYRREAGLPDAGLAIWSVRINPTTKKLLEIPSYDGDGKDSTLFLIPPAGTPGEPVGTNGLWSQANGTATLRWLSDGRTATRVSVQSLDAATNTMTVRIGGGTCPS